MKTNQDTADRPEICVILSTVPPGQSGNLAQSLLLANLAACVNIMPVRSLYRWKGESCDDQEDMLIIKTRRDLVDQAILAIKRAHSYEVPEIIVIPVVTGHTPYLDWVYTETQAI